MSLDATLRALERASRSGGPAATRAYLVAECRARTGHALEPACWLSRGPERPFVPGHLWSCCSCGEASVSVPSEHRVEADGRVVVEPGYYSVSHIASSGLRLVESSGPHPNAAPLPGEPTHTGGEG